MGKGRPKKEVEEAMPPVRLDSVEWMNTPYAMLKMGGEGGYSLVEQRVLLKVSEALQTFIGDFYREGRDKSNEKPLSLFTEKLLSEGLPVIHMSAADFSLSSSNYAEVFQAFEKVSKLQVKGPKYDDKGNYLGDDFYNVFSHFFMPKNDNGYKYTDKEGQEQVVTRYKGYADFSINPNVAKYAFNMEKGYVNHPKEISFKSQQLYAPLLYFLLKHHAAGKSNVTVPYGEVQDMTGSVTRDPDDRHIISNAFPVFSKFKQRVLDPAKAELKRMGEKNLIDITFEYEAIYKGKVKRGDPDSITFTIEQTDLGIFHSSSKKKKAEMLAEQLKKGKTKIDDSSQTTIDFGDGVGEKPDYPAQILSSLRSSFGNGQQGYDYYFGKRARASVDDGHTQVVLSVPSSVKESIKASDMVMEKIHRAVIDVIGHDCEVLIV